MQGLAKIYFNNDVNKHDRLLKGVKANIRKSVIPRYEFNQGKLIHQIQSKNSIVLTVSR
jgi:hypothetical protein